MHKKPLFWKELYVLPGDNINNVVSILIEHAPAYCNFNGVKVEAFPFEKDGGGIIERYLKELKKDDDE